LHFGRFWQLFWPDFFSHFFLFPFFCLLLGGSFWTFATPFVHAPTAATMRAGTSTGANVVSEVLSDALLKDLERDLVLIIDAFDGGYEPPGPRGSLTSGELLAAPLFSREALA
jgi:hypothetical protein